jgi:dihydrofolate synthase/folylpolyglutamate synthase
VVVSHPQVEEVDKVIREACTRKGVELIRVGREVIPQSIRHNRGHQELKIQGRLNNYKIELPLLGPYQVDNAAAAVAALEILREKGYPISKDQIQEGLVQVKFPGRMQIIKRRPLIVVDGGHNPGAAKRLKEALLQYFQPVKSILVLGVSRDKDIWGIVRELAPAFSKVIVTRADNPRAANPEVLLDAFAQYKLEVQITENVPEALKKALAQANKEDLICVTGSFFVVGEALAFMQKSKTNC